MCLIKQSLFPHLGKNGQTRIKPTPYFGSSLLWISLTPTPVKTQSQESIVVSELSVSVFVFVLFCCLSLFLKNHVRHLSTQSSHTSQSWYWVLLGAQKHLFVYLFNFFLSLSSFPSIFLPFFPLFAYV